MRQGSLLDGYRRRLHDPQSAVAAAIRGIATTLMQAVAGVALARALAPDVRGRVAVVVAAATLSASAGSLGLELGIRFKYKEYSREYGARGSLVIFSVAARRARLTTATLALAATAAYAAAVDWYTPVVLLYLVLSAGALLEANLRRSFVRAMGNTTAGAANEALMAATLLVGYALLVVWNRSHGLGAPMAIFILAAGAAALAAQRLISQDRKAIVHAPTHAVTALLRGSMRAHIGTLAMTIAYRADRIVLAMVVPPDAIGEYAIAVSLTELVSLVPTTVSHVVMSRTAFGMNSSARATRIALSVGVIVAAGIWITSGRMIPLVFGPEYAGAVAFVPPLLGAALVQSVWRLQVSARLGRGQTRPFVVSASVAAAVLVSLTAYFADAVGAVGAAWASLVAYSCALILLWLQT